MAIDEAQLRTLLPRWLATAQQMELAEFLVSVSHPDVVVHTPDGRVGGTALIREYISHLKRAFPDLEMIVEHLTVAGDRMLLQFTLEGHHTGPLGFILPTHRVVTSPGALVARVGEDERIIELWAYVNMAVALLGQLDSLGPDGTRRPPDAPPAT